MAERKKIGLLSETNITLIINKEGTLTVELT